MALNFRPRLPSRGVARAAAIAGIGVAVIGGVGLVLWLNSTSSLQSADSSTPGGVPYIRGDLAGENRTAEDERLRQLSAAQNAELARRQGQTYTPQMGGFQTSEPGDTGPPGKTTVRLEEPAPAPQQNRSAQTANNTAQGRTTSDADVAAYRDAMKSLFLSMGGKDPSLNIYDDATGARPGQARLARAQGVGTSAAGGGRAVAPASNQRPRRTLMEAGTGVYGRIIVGGSTDQGSPTIIAEALSGPIAGARFIGSFARQGSGNQPGALLGLRFSSVSINGRPVPVEAFAVDPDSMTSAVASRVDPHTVERVLLPMAAAFVQGLGQALLSSGSVVSAGPYGGFSALRQFSPEQMLGIAAGSAGASAGQLLREQAPRERTIFIDGGAEIGIMFKTPLEIED